METWKKGRLRFCCICRIPWSPDSPSSLFSFPRNPIKRAQWCTILGLEYHPQYKVCSKHFSPKDIMNNFGRTQLRKDATPQKMDSITGSFSKYKPTEVFYLEASSGPQFVEVVDTISDAIHVQPVEIKSTAKVLEHFDHDYGGDFPIRVAIIEKDPLTSESAKVAEVPRNTESNETVSRKKMKKSHSIGETSSTQCRKMFRYVGDFSPSDLQCPWKARHALQLANKKLAQQRLTIKSLRTKYSRLSKKLASLQAIFKKLSGPHSKGPKLLPRKSGLKPPFATLPETSRPPTNGFK